MTGPEVPSTLPQSTILAEATGDSISELLSRDPEGYSSQDLAKVIQTYRDLRERLAKADSAAASGPKEPKAPKGPRVPRSLSTDRAIEDL
jgi:hypothetical protein